ncbi:MAG: hypothetical protein ABIN48_13610 [Ginsengibacter sp.]
MKKYFRVFIIVSCLTNCVLFANGQQKPNSWTEVKLKGHLIVKTVNTTKSFNEEGKLIEKTEEEINYSADQDLVLFPGRYQILSKDEKQLSAFTQGGQNKILRGGSESESAAIMPISYSIDAKTWRICGNELVLSHTTKGNGNITNNSTTTYINLIRTSTKSELKEDEFFRKSMQEFSEATMKERRRMDIKAGKVINEDDYFVPETLPYNETTGLYLFTYGGGTWGSYNPTGPKAVVRYYDCEFKKWENDSPKGMGLNGNILSGEEGKLKKSYSEGKDRYIYRSPYISRFSFEELVKNPKLNRTFNSMEMYYQRIFSGNTYTEYETKTLITLSVN